jgi:nucleoside-diphosphate-sugar epimerase
MRRRTRVRIEQENRLKDAARQGMRSLIVRFGDCFGPKPGNNWFSQGMVTAKRPLRNIAYPGKQGVGHSWTYLPHAGQAFAQFMDREAELEDFASFHFRGFRDQDGTEMIAAIRRVAGKPSLP